MANIEYKRLVFKSGNGVPTIPPSPSHDTGDWIATDIYENEVYVDQDTGSMYRRYGDSIILIGSTMGLSLLPAIDFTGAVASAPPTENDGDVYVLKNETTAAIMDVDRIEWQLGTINGVRYYFNEFAMMIDGVVAIGDYLHASGATNIIHNGSFVIVDFDDIAGWIEINNTDVIDATDDEASDSPALAHFTKAAWDGGKINDVVEFHSESGIWIAATPIEGQIILILSKDALYMFNGTSWVVLIPNSSETVKGIIEIATEAETITGTDDTRAVTPLKLTSWWTNIKTVVATIVGGWTFELLYVKAIGAAFKTRITSAAAADQTWTIPAEGDQTFASRTYVDNIAAGLKWKQPVRVATTANGTLASAFENGDTVDGIVLATNDRILLKNQTDQKENGIYVVQAAGAPIRSTDADTGDELISAAVFVREGTVNADKAFVCPQDSITIGVDDITFINFAAITGALLASNNLSDVASAATALSNIGGQALLITRPEGFLLNGVINVSVASDDLIIAIKTAAGTDPSASDTVYVMINGVMRSITSSLSITLADGTNYFNAGGAELATFEIDYFVFLGWNVADSTVVLGVSRVLGLIRSDFSQTNTNEKFLSESYTTGAATTDKYNVIGRFAATLSAGAGYTWTVPTFTGQNLIQRPIFETRWLNSDPNPTGFSSLTAEELVYKVLAGEVRIKPRISGVSNTTGFTFYVPISSSSAFVHNFPILRAVNNGGGISGFFRVGADNIVTGFATPAGGVWTASGTKSLEQVTVIYLT